MVRLMKAIADKTFNFRWQDLVSTIMLIITLSIGYGIAKEQLNATIVKVEKLDTTQERLIEKLNELTVEVARLRAEMEFERDRIYNKQKE